MKRYDRMIEMQGQIVSIISSLEPSRCNEIEVASILANLALSHHVPSYIFVNGKKKNVG